MCLHRMRSLYSLGLAWGAHTPIPTRPGIPRAAEGALGGWTSHHGGNSLALLSADKRVSSPFLLAPRVPPAPGATACNSRGVMGTVT